MRHSNIPASYLVLMKESKILLLRRENTGFEDGKYSLIAGHVDPNESFTKCIVREAYEEAGIIITPENLKMAHFLHRKSTHDNEERIDAFFIAENWEGILENKEIHKCDDLSWFDLDNIPENIIPYIKHVLDNIKLGIKYSEFGW